MIFKISKTWILVYQKEYLQCSPSWSLVTQVFNSSVARGKAGKIKVLPEEELGGWDGGGRLPGFGQHLSTNLPGSILYFNNIYICVCVLSHFSCARLFATLWTLAFQAPLSMGFSRQEYWSGLPRPPPGDLPNPGIELTSPALQADSWPLSHQGSPYGKSDRSYHIW